MHSQRAISRSVAVALMLLCAAPAAGGALSKRLYLNSHGNANTASGDGVLSAEPATRGASDRYTFDPKAARQDALVYTTAALEKPLQVNGPVTMDLYAASDARDTNFTAALADVEPDGKAVPLGAVRIIRAGDRTSAGLLTPGKPEFFRFDLGAVMHAFLPGHRVRLEISSSAAPGGAIANQRVLHNEAHPSALVLPVAE
jgi:putative CocE/NonD family hydrolase